MNAENAGNTVTMFVASKTQTKHKLNTFVSNLKLHCTLNHSSSSILFDQMQTEKKMLCARTNVIQIELSKIIGRDHDMDFFPMQQ